MASGCGEQEVGVASGSGWKYQKNGAVTGIYVVLETFKLNE